MLKPALSYHWLVWHWSSSVNIHILCIELSITLVLDDTTKWIYDTNLTTRRIPSTSIPSSRTITMTTSYIICSTRSDFPSSTILPRIQLRSSTSRYWIPLSSICNDPLIPRCICRRFIPRMPHFRSTKGSKSWSCSIYYLRSILLCKSILSILP